MESPSTSVSLVLIFHVILTFCSYPTHSKSHDNFLECLSLDKHTPASYIVYTPNNSSYLSILQSSIFNHRFTTPFYPKPLFIITPTNETQIQTIILCSKETGILIRTLSGGHDYEGLSLTAQFSFITAPFIIVDLINLTDISIEVHQKTAWVQGGATVGQLYYRISQHSKSLAFPAGECPTVGVGGHFSGGGYGPLMRKYGLAADNIIDARIVDAKGRLLDRKSMGEDLFWAIRGGGGASFGVITAWKLKLVEVPDIVTTCSVRKTLEQNATEVIHKWQYVAPNLPKDLMILPFVSRVDSTIQVEFKSLFLGRVDRLIELLGVSFPELGIEGEDCDEVSWVQSALFIAGYPIESSPEVLSSRGLGTIYFKVKGDYVQEPIPLHGFKGMWKLLLDKDIEKGFLYFTPYGGEMNEVSESSIPFPHRAGNMYTIQQIVDWDRSDNVAPERYVNWSRKLYKYLTPFVSKSPRVGYVNYRDLDLGVNEEGHISYEKASIWGVKYFKNNFNRLVQIKTMVDPCNFFRNEQSIPSLTHFIKMDVGENKFVE